VHPVLVGEPGEGRTVQVGVDDASLDMDVIPTSRPNAQSLDVDQVVAQGSNPRKNLAGSLDPDSARYRDTVADGEFPRRPPAFWRQKGVPA